MIVKKLTRSMALEFWRDVTSRIFTATVMRTRDMTWTWAVGIETLHGYWESMSRNEQEFPVQVIHHCMTGRSQMSLGSQGRSGLLEEETSCTV